MKIIDTDISDVKIIEPEIFGDARGYFFETWVDKKYSDAGISCDWVQDNESRSKYGVLRGLHYQLFPFAQAKLVRVVLGKVLDVAVDIRRGSDTFGKHVAVELSGENKRQLYIPRGFAHGFVVLSEDVIFQYKCDNIYAPKFARGIAFNDPVLNIDWRVPVDKLILSEKDRLNPCLAYAEVF